MVRVLLALFLLLHGLVHLLYLGQSRRLFELQPGLGWPDGSWALSGWAGDGSVRTMAAVCLLLAALGFLVGGLGLLFGLPWWPVLAMGTAVFSSLIFLLFWNGALQRLDDQGGVGLLLNLAILGLLIYWQNGAF